MYSFIIFNDFSREKSNENFKLEPSDKVKITKKGMKKNKFCFSTLTTSLNSTVNSCLNKSLKTMCFFDLKTNLWLVMNIFPSRPVSLLAKKVFVGIKPLKKINTS